MLHLLSDNILQYVLNQYLDLEEDISKLKQMTSTAWLYNIKFNIKTHINCIRNYQFKNSNAYKIYFDNKLIRIKLYYLDWKPMLEERYKNGILVGMQREWYKNGQLMRINNYVYGLKVGIQKYYGIDGTLIREIEIG
jgi:antitoxin component YwqK of YwqJK toxin-antitoxin module